MEHSQVTRTIEILHSDPQTLTFNDIDLITDLKTQLILYCANFEGGTRTEEQELESKLYGCVDFLHKRIEVATQTITNNNAYYNTNASNNMESNNRTNESTAPQEPSQNVITVVTQGKKVYYMDGEPIRFKVFKNKPKNGDFKVRWNRNFEMLKQFKEHYGHLHVTRNTPKYEDLGNWVAEQRRKLKRGKVTIEQFEAMTQLGFEWDRSYYFHKTYEEKKRKRPSFQGEEE